MSENSCDLKEILDSNHLQLAQGARRVRFAARLWSLGVVGLGYFLDGGFYWVWGAALGWLVVEINLSLLVRAIDVSPKWRNPSLKSVLFFFYLAFGLTILFCFLTIKHDLGNPLAFLFGLLSFIAGLVSGLLSMLVKKMEKPS